MENRRSGLRKMSDAIFVAANTSGGLRIGDKREIDRRCGGNPVVSLHLTKPTLSW